MFDMSLLCSHLFCQKKIIKCCRTENVPVTVSQAGSVFPQEGKNKAEQLLLHTAATELKARHH